MKTIATLLALSAAAALSLAFVPSALEAMHLLSAFAATFVALIAFSDYARPVHHRRYLASLARSTPRHPHPYAA